MSRIPGEKQARLSKRRQSRSSAHAFRIGLAEEQEGSEETSPCGDAVEEAEPVEESTEEAVRAFRSQLPRQKSPGIKLELIRGMPPFCRSPPYETIETNI
ncbi:MAG: hypothetical protein QF920_01115 [Verrucomicrobiota bacterium]|nr:hypothetical protein [Verrucomicrobiota bacterium]